MLRAAVAGFLVVAVLASAFVLVRLDRLGVRSFVLTGSHVAAGPLDPELQRLPGPGYDGQFFYRLALDPLTPWRAGHGVRLDRPAYRQTRIGYPLLAWAASGNRDAAVPYTLIAVNVAAFAAVGALGAALGRRLSGSAASAVVLVAYPGFVVSLARDLSEVVAAAFVLGALLAWRSRSTAAVVALLTAAALTRETTVLLAGAAGALTWWQQRRLTPALPFAIPVVALIGWQGFMTLRWGELPTPPLPGFDWPLRGLLGAGTWTLLDLAGGAVLAGVLIAALAAVRSGAAREAPLAAWSLAPYAALLLVLGASIWVEAYAFLRAGTELHLAAATLALARPSPWLPAVAAVNGLATALFVAVFVLVG